MTFIFATTELRKVPVTVVVALPALRPAAGVAERACGAFRHHCRAEGARITADALAIIARAADGSVRDGLSLLDQAISLGESAPAGGTVEVDAAMVADMLGLPTAAWYSTCSRR